jgi:diadenosine tetraphosphatase ApaH/serine/threonine PP2A family protein phosphatase
MTAGMASRARTTLRVHVRSAYYRHDGRSRIADGRIVKPAGVYYWKSFSSESASSLRNNHRTAHAHVVASPSQPLQPPPHAASGAWILLAALEKSIEAQGVHVARLVSSFEVLLPRPDDDDHDHDVGFNEHPVVDRSTGIDDGSSPLSSPHPPLVPVGGVLPDNAVEKELHQKESEHSNDPAFFSFLPHMNSAQAMMAHQHHPAAPSTSPSISSSISSSSSSTLPIIQRQHIVEMLYATRHGRRIALSTIQALIQAATWQNSSQRRDHSNIVYLPSLQQQQQQKQKHQQQQKRVTVVGDLHGSLSDLEAVLAFVGEPSENHVLVFNGDLADRGEHGIEVIAIVCALMLAYPNRVIVNRGNHEDVALCIAYGLALEVRHKYGIKTFSKTLAPQLDAFFRSLPLATVVQGDALIVHAGPPPPGVCLKDIAGMKMEQSMVKDGRGYSRTVRSVTDSHHEQPNGGALDPDLIVEALLWSDPILDEVKGALKDNSTSQHDKMWKPNKSRGAGFKFDSNIVRNLLRQEGLFRFIRSHEPVKNGCVRYTIHSPPPGGDSEDGDEENEEQFQEFFTLFSASRYPNKEGFNKGAILTLLPNGQHRITRYDTENDDPVMEVSKILTTTAAHVEATSEASALHDGHHIEEECGVDSIVLRRALSEAISSHRSQLERTLEQVAAAKNVKVHQLAFDDAVDTLFKVLHLEGEGLCQYGPRLALAKALSRQEGDILVLPESIDIIHALDECLAEQDTAMYSIHLNWLHSIFSLVDADHDGQISSADWKAAVATINANLPTGGGSRNGSIDADETWTILDLDEDGYVSAEDWDAVLLDVSLTSK